MMSCRVLLVTFLCVVCTHAVSADVQTRVYGGKDAPASEWPWMVAVLDDSTTNDYQAQFCAGTLISPQWIVSAAHCFHPKGESPLDPSQISVLINTIELCNDCKGNRREIDNIIIPLEPDGWNTSEGSNNANDIALLRLSNPVDPASIARASIIDPQRAAALPDTGNDGVQVLGWGAVAPIQDTAEEGYYFLTSLQQVALDYVDLDRCKAFYVDDSLFSPSMICAHEPES